MRIAHDRWLLVPLVLDAALLAVVELFYLPMRFDGQLLPKLAGSWPFPITALLAAVTTPWLVRAAAALDSRLSVAGAPLLAWLVVLVVLAVGGPGGGVLLLPDWRTLLLLAGGALPAAVTLGGVMGKPAQDREPQEGPTQDV